MCVSLFGNYVTGEMATLPIRSTSHFIGMFATNIFFPAFFYVHRCQILFSFHATLGKNKRKHNKILLPVKIFLRIVLPSPQVLEHAIQSDQSLYSHKSHDDDVMHLLISILTLSQESAVDETRTCLRADWPTPHVTVHADQSDHSV